MTAALAAQAIAGYATSPGPDHPSSIADFRILGVLGARNGPVYAAERN
jgi:hypothetical protein